MLLYRNSTCTMVAQMVHIHIHTNGAYVRSTYLVRTYSTRVRTNTTLSQKRLDIQALRCNGDTTIWYHLVASSWQLWYSTRGMAITLVLASYR